jgi:serine/threonine-protein kinase HipA
LTPKLFPADDFPHLPENEHCIMQLAKVVGLYVAQNTLVPFESGELAYLIKRFDILKDATRLFIEDAASLCLVAPVNKGSDALSYEDTLNTLFTVSGQNRGVTLNGFRQVLFAYIVGNNDLHLKNLSLFRKPNSQSHFMTNFTPVYDVLSVAPYPKYYGVDLSLRLLNSELEAVFSEAYEQYGYYTGYDFITFGQQIGLSNSATKKLIKQLFSAVEGTYEYIINASQCPDGMKHEIKSHIAEKLGRLSRPYPVNLV